MVIWLHRMGKGGEKMDFSDPYQTARVWARVYGGSADNVCSLPAQLAAWVLQCRSHSIAYYYLARLAPEVAPALRQLAQQCAAQANTLAALYVSLTGKRLIRPQPLADTETDLPTLFSSLYQREIDCAQQLAEADGPHAETLRQQAQAQRRRAARLMELAARYL